MQEYYNLILKTFQSQIEQKYNLHQYKFTINESSRYTRLKTKKLVRIL